MSDEHEFFVNRDGSASGNGVACGTIRAGDRIRFVQHGRPDIIQRVARFNPDGSMVLEPVEAEPSA